MPGRKGVSCGTWTRWSDFKQRLSPFSLGTPHFSGWGELAGLVVVTGSPRAEAARSKMIHYPQSIWGNTETIKRCKQTPRGAQRTTYSSGRLQKLVCTHL